MDLFLFYEERRRRKGVGEQRCACSILHHVKPSNLKNILLLHAQPKKEKRKRTKAIKGYEKRNREMNNLW